MLRLKLNHVSIRGHWCRLRLINTLRPRQHGRHFADDTFKAIFLNENIGISIKISLKSVSKVPINNIPALVQIMAWRWPGDKPLSEPRMVRLSAHICVIRPQWVNVCWNHHMLGYLIIKQPWRGKAHKALNSNKTFNLWGHRDGTYLYINLEWDTLG